MKILFRLPRGGNGLPATMHKNKIALSIREWAKQHNVDDELIKFDTRGYDFTVWLPHPEDVAVLKLTYTDYPFKILF